MPPIHDTREGVVRGLARPTEVRFYPVQACPLVQMLRGELRAVVHPDGPGQPVLLQHPQAPHLGYAHALKLFLPAPMVRRQKVCSLMPILRQTSDTGVPASACRRPKATCSGVYRELFMGRSSLSYQFRSSHKTAFPLEHFSGSRSLLTVEREVPMHGGGRGQKAKESRGGEPHAPAVGCRAQTAQADAAGCAQKIALKPAQLRTRGRVSAYSLRL